MRLYEYEGVNLFEAMGIPVPQRGVAETRADAIHIAEQIGYPVILKAQVLVGGRGLAGGIRTAANAKEVETLSDQLFNTAIKGFAVRRLLVSKKAEVLKEFYLGITIDGYSGTPILVVSTEGGANIEETARTHPEKIASMKIQPTAEFYPFHARSLFRKLGLSQNLMVSCADILVKLYRVFTAKEALIAEINPLAVLPNDAVLALDAVLEVDNSALFRIKPALPRPLERMDNPLERYGKEIGVTYVDLTGDIGIISSGAGLGMASMDIIARRLRPANFLETGGGITEALLYNCMQLVLMKKGLRAIFINIYGGINPIHEGAKGVVRYIKEHHLSLPIVAKALGNHQEETWEILRSGGVHVVTEAATEIAVERLFELVNNRK